MPAKSPEPPKPEPAKESSLVSLYLSDPENLPAELKQLMETDDISEWEIQQVVFARGYFPDNTPIEKMEQSSPGFIKGWIVQYWPQVRDMALKIRKEEGVPFN